MAADEATDVDMKSLLTELSIMKFISRDRHLNVVNLLGCCTQGTSDVSQLLGCCTQGTSDVI